MKAAQRGERNSHLMLSPSVNKDPIGCLVNETNLEEAMPTACMEHVATLMALALGVRADGVATKGPYLSGGGKYPDPGHSPNREYEPRPLIIQPCAVYWIGNIV